MDEWKVGDPADWGDHVGVPDIPYMGYLNDDDDDEETPEWKNKADTLGEKAWKLYRDGRRSEALTIINEALSYDNMNSDNWNIKAIILQGVRRFEESNECYDKSLKLARSRVVVENKAKMLKDWAYGLYLDYEGDMKKAFDLISEAIAELSSIETEEDIKSYRDLKRLIQGQIERYKK